MILFQPLDAAVQYPYQDRKLSTYLIETLELELKLLLVFSEPREFLVAPRTFLAESEISLAVLRRTRNLFLHGLIRVFGETADTMHFWLEKAETHTNVRHLPKYSRAYYTKKIRQEIESLPLWIVPRGFSPGELAHNAWVARMLNLAKHDSSLTMRIKDLAARHSALDSGNSTWESLLPLLDRGGFTYNEIQQLAMRELSCATYVNSYRSHDVQVPTGSQIIHPYIEGDSSMDINIAHLHTYARICGLVRTVGSLNVEQIQRIRILSSTEQIRAFMRQETFPPENLTRIFVRDVKNITRNRLLTRVHKMFDKDTRMETRRKLVLSLFLANEMTRTIGSRRRSKVDPSRS